MEIKNYVKYANKEWNSITEVVIGKCFKICEAVILVLKNYKLGMIGYKISLIKNLVQTFLINNSSFKKNEAIKVLDIRWRGATEIKITKLKNLNTKAQVVFKSLTRRSIISSLKRWFKEAKFQLNFNQDLATRRHLLLTEVISYKRIKVNQFNNYSLINCS